MCGIAALISKNKIINRKDRVKKMCTAMAHRGPNANVQIEINDYCILGHVRLSILDLQEQSNQPMSDISERFYISYNGEIVNFIEIRQKLNYKFKTMSDTEVILASVLEHGLDWFLNNAVGMFAFVLYDKETQQTYLVRDRFGIKPLLYTEQNNILIIASEVQGLLNSGLLKAELNGLALDDYLGYRYIREPFTFFNDIYQVPHATYLIFDSNLLLIKEKKYYNLPPLNFDIKYDEKKIKDKLTELLITVFKRWMISDVKVGSYLSGGLDSSLLTAIISKWNPNLDTYTIGFDDNETNEFKYASLVSKKYHTKHREFIISLNEYLKEDEMLPLYKGAPLGVPNESLLSIMTSKLSKDITVVISGEGADELFAGYGRIYRSPFDYKNHISNCNFYEYFYNCYEYIPRSFRNKYLKDNNSNREYYDNILNNEFSQYNNEENVFRFFHNYHIQGLLQRLDTCTMRSSIESRPPFLDHVLVDFVYREIPFELKLKWKNNIMRNQATKLFSKNYSEQYDIPKYILKSIAKNYLPESIVYRKKMGFPVPLTNNISLLEEQTYKLIECKLLSISDNRDFIIDIKKLSNPGQALWMFICITNFIDIFFKREWRY